MGLASKVNSKLGAGGPPPAGGALGGAGQGPSGLQGAGGNIGYPSAVGQQSQFPGQPGAPGQYPSAPGQAQYPGSPGQASQFPGQLAGQGQQAGALQYGAQQGAPQYGASGPQNSFNAQQPQQGAPQYGASGPQNSFNAQQPQQPQQQQQQFGRPMSQVSSNASSQGFGGRPGIPAGGPSFNDHQGFSSMQQQQQPGGYGQQQPFGAPQQQQQGSFGTQQSFGGQQQAGYGGAAPSANAQYAGTHGLMGGPGSAGNVMPVIKTKLANMVQTNHLQGFFPRGLNHVFQRLDCVNFAGLSQKWDMPLELATDLAQLALYDIVIFADDSGSMVFEEHGERIDDLKLILGRVAEVATLFDDDGILVRFMNSQVQGDGIRTPEAATSLVQQIQFSGMTPLGTNLHTKVIQPFLHSGIQRQDLAKPILCVVITDGEPVGEDPGTVKRVIMQAKQMASNSKYGPGAIAFQFAQVGKDVKAQRFLGVLDNDPDVGNSIDATSYYELEAEEYAQKGVTLTPELWLCKLMLGAIDPSYDEQDE